MSLLSCIGTWCACAILGGFIVWVSLSAACFVEYQNIRRTHTATTCLLLNYSCRAYMCRV